jgi:hypothetical protein
MAARMSLLLLPQLELLLEEAEELALARRSATF